MMPPASQKGARLFIGTYTGGDSEGIYVCRLDPGTGELRDKQLAGRCDNPSYLAMDPGGNRLYAVNEMTTFQGQPGGAVSAFAVDAATGRLTPINQVPTHGGAPCYVTAERQGRYLLVANYVGGNVTVIPVDRDGRLGPASDVVNHHGRSAHPTRQTAPHPHSVITDRSGAHVFVPDLGLDRIMQYRLDRVNGALAPGEEAWTATAAGAGPRHMVFDSSGRFAFVVNELDSTVGAYAWDREREKLSLIQTISTLPAAYDGPNIAADLHLAPDGRFLYASNRGHDSIAVFRVDGDTGRLTAVDRTPTGGKTPRGFTLDPSGRFLLAANQDSDKIVIFSVDQAKGTLLPTGHTLDIASPVCLKFFPHPVR